MHHHGVMPVDPGPSLISCVNCRFTTLYSFSNLHWYSNRVPFYIYDFQMHWLPYQRSWHIDRVPANSTHITFIQRIQHRLSRKGLKHVESSRICCLTLSMSSSRKIVLSSGSRGGITDSDQTYDIVPVHSVQGLRTVNPGIRDKLDRKAFFEITSSKKKSKVSKSKR